MKKSLAYKQGWYEGRDDFVKKLRAELAATQKMVKFGKWTVYLSDIHIAMDKVLKG